MFVLVLRFVGEAAELLGPPRESEEKVEENPFVDPVAVGRVD